MNIDFDKMLNELTKEQLLEIVRLFKKRFEVGREYQTYHDDNSIGNITEQMRYMINTTYLKLLNASIYRYSEPEKFGHHQVGDIVNGYEILDVYHNVKYKKRKRIKTTSQIFDVRYAHEKGWMYVDDHHVEFILDNFPKTRLVKLKDNEFEDFYE